MLHSSVKRVFHDQYIGEAEQVDKFERQAERFAAAFLMPIPLLVIEFFAAVKTHAPGAKQAVETAVMSTPQSEELWRELVIPRLESRFAVSRNTTCRREALRLCLSVAPGNIRTHRCGPRIQILVRGQASRPFSHPMNGCFSSHCSQFSVHAMEFRMEASNSTEINESWALTSSDGPPPPNEPPLPEDVPTKDVRGQCFMFCVRCGFAATSAGDCCDRCGVRRCASCSE